MEFLSLLWIRRSKTPREVPWTPAAWGAFQRQPSGQPLPCARSVPGVWHGPEAQLKQGHRVTMPRTSGTATLRSRTPGWFSRLLWEERRRVGPARWKAGSEGLEEQRAMVLSWNVI